MIILFEFDMDVISSTFIILMASRIKSFMEGGSKSKTLSEASKEIYLRGEAGLLSA
jgi:hypothetical protein